MVAEWLGRREAAGDPRKTPGALGPEEWQLVGMRYQEGRVAGVLLGPASQEVKPRQRGSREKPLLWFGAVAFPGAAVFPVP